IENKPLTRMADLPINVVNQKHLDLTKSGVPDLEKKLMEVVAKASKMKGVIVASGRGEENFVMANITPSKKKDKTLVFAEPNPVILYYNSGIEHIKSAIEIRNNILKSELGHEELYAIFCDFYKESFQGITQMIMAMESLFNQKIPENIELELDGETLTKERIEWKDFKTKLRHIVPQLTGIDFYADHNTDYQNITEVNNLRNNLIHLKSLKEDNYTHYQALCKALIDFDYEKNCTSIHKAITLLM
ncbi:hypothetical protein, partial [Kordia sp.]|uniref:hypothetical protein n=1 Tax=Kordia sp. TaxID=1965332 RepID=UPI0025C5C887